jgi:hypothetical protein
MTITLALRLSGAVLALSLLALVCDVAIFLLHIPVAPKTKQTLDIAAFVWPLALVFFGTYLRKAQAAAQRQNPPR